MSVKAFKDRFDPSKLAQMREPFTVRVERTSRGMRQPVITLPRGDALPGYGWSMAEVSNIEQEIVKIGGGGIYNVQISDANAEKMEWNFFIDPRSTPERPLPTTLDELYAVMAGSPMAHPAQFGAAPMQPMQPMQVPAPVQVAAAPVAAPQPAPVGPPSIHLPSMAHYQWPVPPPAHQPSAADWRESRRRQEEDKEAERKLRELEQRNRELQDAIAKQEKEKLEAAYRAELQQIQQKQEQQQAAFQEELRKLRESAHQVQANPQLEELKLQREQLIREREKQEMEDRFKSLQDLIARIAEAKAQPTGPSPELQALQDRLRQQEEEIKRERDRSEADRRERELKEEIRRQEERFREALHKIEQGQNRGPDPTVLLMQEMMRQQVEGQKEQMRTQQAFIERFSNFSMTPRDMMDLMRESQGGMEQFREVSRNIVGVYGDIFQTQKNLVEQAMQMAGGGGDPASVRLLESGLQTARDMADRYLKMKQAQAVSAAGAQKAAYEAQAYVATEAARMRAQQAAANIAAQAAQAAAQAQTQQAAQQAAAGSGLGGVEPPSAPAATNGARKKQKSAQAEAAAPQTVPASAPAPQVAEQPEESAAEPAGAKIIPLRRLGKTDTEWFGDALPQVDRLREQVGIFLDAIGQEPPRLGRDHRPLGYDPSQTVEAVLKAVNTIAALGMSVPAFDLLFMEQRFADLIDVLIPDAPMPYRADCVEMLAQIAKAAEESEDADEADDDDDIDDGDEAAELE